MKRSFAALALILALSASLCGCHERIGNGNIGESPSPAFETPVIPSPDLMPSTEPAEDQTGPTDRESTKNSRAQQPDVSTRPSEQAR